MTHIHQTAQGIASLGRYGDDLLVHMNQEEVQGLQSLAKQHGTSLTINPETGMPEAFKLGNVFKAVLPIAAGFALGPGGFGLGESMFGAGSFMSSALGTGLLVGGATAALTGNLGQGLMAGLGAYSGFGLSDTLSKMGTAAPLTQSAITDATAKAAGSNLVGQSSNFISPFTPTGVAGQQAANAGISGLGVNNIANTIPTSGFAQSWQGTKNLFSPGGFDKLKDVLGTTVPGKEAAITGTTYGPSGNVISNTYSPATAATIKPASTGAALIKVGGPFVQAGLAGVEPSDFMEQPLSQQEEKVYEQTGVDDMGKPTFGYIAKSAFNPYRTLNLSGPSPLNLGTALKLPATTGYAEGGSIATGGVSDLYTLRDGTNAQDTPMESYGLGRLNNLASAQSIDQAKTMGYKVGGYLDGQGDGMSDSIPATIEGKQPARLADGEFVVPADVVSHLGNGSSKAGSKKLYAMLNKVRKARTGNTRQGKQINPDKYLTI